MRVRRIDIKGLPVQRGGDASAPDPLAASKALRAKAQELLSEVAVLLKKRKPSELIPSRDVSPVDRVITVPNECDPVRGLDSRHSTRLYGPYTGTGSLTERDPYETNLMLRTAARGILPLDGSDIRNDGLPPVDLDDPQASLRARAEARNQRPLPGNFK